MEIAKLTWNAGKVVAFNIHKIGERMAEKFLAAFKGFDEPVWVRVEDLPNYGIKVEAIKPEPEPEQNHEPEQQATQDAPTPKPRGRKPSK